MLFRKRVIRYVVATKPAIHPADKIEEDGAPADRGYAAWERAKVERGLAQSRDREAMIRVEQIWHDLKLEGYLHPASAG